MPQALQFSPSLWQQVGSSAFFVLLKVYPWEAEESGRTAWQNRVAPTDLPVANGFHRWRFSLACQRSDGQCWLPLSLLQVIPARGKARTIQSESVRASAADTYQRRPKFLFQSLFSLFAFTVSLPQKSRAGEAMRFLLVLAVLPISVNSYQCRVGDSERHGRGYILKDCRVPGQEFGTKIQEDRGKALL